MKYEHEHSGKGYTQHAHHFSDSGCVNEIKSAFEMTTYANTCPMSNYKTFGYNNPTFDGSSEWKPRAGKYLVYHLYRDSLCTQSLGTWGFTAEANACLPNGDTYANVPNGNIITSTRAK